MNVLPAPDAQSENGRIKEADNGGPYSRAGAMPRECAALNNLAHLPFSFGAPLYRSA